MTMAAALLQELDQEAVTTRRVIERVPGAQLDWRPHPTARSLGELAAHVATLPGAIAEMATHDQFQASNIPQTPALTGAELSGALESSLQQARTTLSSMGDGVLTSSWTMMAGDATVVSMPKAALLRSIMLNHWYHHRGQLTVYLRELGVPVPSIYGPSADENPFGG